MDEGSTQEFLQFGDQLVLSMRELVLSLWESNSFSSRLKDDDTPVSDVDLRCEELARKIIQKRFPDHGIIGEEHGAENQAAEYVWTIDPIDGTQNLINRIPTFGTIVGLLHRGTPALGWIDHPVLGTSLRGGRGVGAYADGKKIVLKDIATDTLTANDVIGTNCPATFMRGGHQDVLTQVLDFHPHSRIYYDVYAHTLAITGSLAVMVEYNLKIWDLAATQALIEAAGGTFLEHGSDKSGEYTLFNAAFGKPKAVELVTSHIATPSS